jgi:outer membrane lipoprotein-sorting protein
VRDRKVLLPLLLLICVSAASAQELTTKSVLEKMDKQAASFTSLQANVTQQYTSYGVKAPEVSGPFYMQSVNGEPRVFYDMTTPPDQAMRVLIDKGKALAYTPRTKGKSERAVDRNSEVLTYLLIGFGSPSSSFTKGYKPEYKGRETIGSVSTAVLELTSISATTRNFPKVVLWLDPKTWTPVKVRLYEVAKDSFKDFTYSSVRLNSMTKKDESIFDSKNVFKDAKDSKDEKKK